MIPEKIPQDFYSRPTEKRLEWWNQLFLSIKETITGITKRLSKLEGYIGQGTVDGVAKKLMWKVITPASPGAPADTGASGSVQYAHGLSSIDNVLDVIGRITSDGLNYYFNGDLLIAQQYFTQIDSTYVYIVGINPYYNNKPYAITIIYYE